MYGCETWTVKKAAHWKIDAFELWCWTLLQSPLDCKEIQSVHSKGDWSWVFFGRNYAKAETPVLWPPHAKSWLLGKDWCWEGLGQEEKGTTEDEMAGWHHWLNGHEFEWTPGVGDGQGGLVCCNSQGRKESDTTERLYWTELILDIFIKIPLPYLTPSWITPLSLESGLHNSVKLWAMTCMATQDEWVIVKSFNKHYLLEEEMATHSSILVSRSSWTVWKRQKDMTLKDELSTQ